MKSLTISLLTILALIINFSCNQGQNKSSKNKRLQNDTAVKQVQNDPVDDQLIVGKWITEADKKSILVFGKKTGYQLYMGNTPDSFKYYIVDSVLSDNTYTQCLKLCFLYENLNEVFEIENLSNKYLSLMDIKTTGQIWVLDRKRTKGK